MLAWSFYASKPRRKGFALEIGVDISENLHTTSDLHEHTLTHCTYCAKK
jgi:hypothetical protein